jgi:hypothetical protein
MRPFAPNAQVSLTTRAIESAWERRLVTADRAACIALRFLDLDCAIVHGNKPAAHLVDIEKVSSVDATQNRLVPLHPVKVKYFLGGL